MKNEKSGHMNLKGNAKLLARLDKIEKSDQVVLKFAECVESRFQVFTKSYCIGNIHVYQGYQEEWDDSIYTRSDKIRQYQTRSV